MKSLILALTLVALMVTGASADRRRTVIVNRGFNRPANVVFVNNGFNTGFNNTFAFRQPVGTFGVFSSNPVFFRPRNTVFINGFGQPVFFDNGFNGTFGTFAVPFGCH